MIVSASRRTDIPAFYSQWFMQRIREGYCLVANPFNCRQISRVSLRPEDVEVIAFWSKNPRPLMPHLKELDCRGYRYFFHFTLNVYPAELEPHLPDAAARIAMFRQLAETIGRDKVIWRYDPIVITNLTGYDYHQEMFQQIAESLKGYTSRVVVSLVEAYRKAVIQFKRLEQQGIYVVRDYDRESLERMIRALARIARANGMEIFSCAEKMDWRPWGVQPGKCIDDRFLSAVFGIAVEGRKDPYQRPECGCIVSKDIGVYGTCLHGCRYCYAGTLNSARKKYAQHDWRSPILYKNTEFQNENFLFEIQKR